MSDTLAAPESVLARATTDVPVAGPADTAGRVRTMLTDRRYGTVTVIPVCAPSGLVGMVTLEDLLPAAPDRPIAELMLPAVTAHRDTDQEVAAWEMVRHGHRALAVVDDDSRLLGVVTPGDMLEVLFVEHEEDLSRLAGVVFDAQQVRTATIESVPRRVMHRIPWLLVGLLGAMLAALIVAGYEEAISRQVVLAFFLPGVVYMADAVGTQTETVVVRGLSVRVSVRQVAPKEALTGLIIGTMVAVLFVPLGLLVFGDLRIMLAVGVALFVSCAIASVVAMALPYLLSKLGRDPAYGSGPLSTVVQDLLTILCYCAIVSTVV
ncbi:MAG TPA: magnesium transporter [Actinomycetota bacterium]|nr:magnesium transporter [Actinomycetota bacterium]